MLKLKMLTLTKLHKINQVALLWGWRYAQIKIIGLLGKIIPMLLVTISNIQYLFYMCIGLPTFERCHQHRNSVTDIPKSSPTLSHQHHDVTNLSNLFLMHQNGIIDVWIFKYGSWNINGFRDPETDIGLSWTDWCRDGRPMT